MVAHTIEEHQMKWGETMYDGCKGMSVSTVSDYDHGQDLIQSLSSAALLTCHSAEMKK